MPSPCWRNQRVPGFIVGGRDQAKLASAYGHPDISAEAVDITDDESIAALADRVGGVDHV
ncbi:MAG: hypothetical protein QOE94_2724, partial [Mycobacterium sp.]|nr:hypothetical protein [Mycobacterium sp.]